MNFIVHCDGGARGNPGPAAVGVVIEKVHSAQYTGHSKKEIVAEISKRIGETTNNVAEYTAVLEALRQVKSLPAGKAGQKSKVKSEDGEIGVVQFYLDSTLVVNQLNGLFKVKEAHLRELLMNVRILEQEIGESVEYKYVHREQNIRADFLVNKALDSDV